MEWKWCLKDADGKIIKGWYQDDSGNWYHLDETDGTMNTGWFQDVKDDGRWYYFNDSGIMQTGWLQLNGIWFYLETDSTGHKGECYMNRTAAIAGKSYTFDADGHMTETGTNGCVSADLVNFTKVKEGFYSEPYYDIAGVKTIGYGMTGAEIDGLTYISEPDAAQKLTDLLNNSYAAPLKSDLDSKGVQLKQNQFDALVDLAYNIGVEAVLSSTIYNKVCAGETNPSVITASFCMWDKAMVNGRLQDVAGLLTRRNQEAYMYLYNVYSMN